MDHDAFTGQVQARARLHSRGAAETATRATLETLAERIPAGLADNLAAQLPHEIGEHLRRVEASPEVPETGIRMDRQEFFGRVAAREGKDVPQAIHHARAVIEVVEEATQGGTADKVRHSLDEGLAGVLFSGSKGRSRG